MPRFPVPAGEDETSWFIKEVETGLQRRFPEGVPDYARKQAAFEEDVIVSKGYPGYFLVVADFINWAKRNGIRVGPGRGSGAGSMCAYAMGITDLDPIPHGLIFERFLNPERMSMPDFDVDFDERRRGEVIRYVTEKYGEERVAQIVTYGTIKAKQALKDAAPRPGPSVQRWARSSPRRCRPDVMGKGMPLAEIFNPEHKRYNEAADFRALVHDEDPHFAGGRRHGAGPRGPEAAVGRPRSRRHHVAASRSSTSIPIMSRLQDGQIITQFDYPTCESLGLVKMDFLGLRNLTILDDAIENIKANRDADIDLDALSKDMTDPATYALLGRGDTLGRLPARRRRHAIAAAAHAARQLRGHLGRPRALPAGPDGRQRPHELRAAQERQAGGHPARPPAEGQAPARDGRGPRPDPRDDLRPGASTRSRSWRSRRSSPATRSATPTCSAVRWARRRRRSSTPSTSPSREGMKAQGFNEASIAALWGVLVPFSDYAFNKAHTAAYGLVSYWTAYLKANYPAEYMAALLTSVRDDKDKSALYLNECRHMGIKVLPPDVNESIANFAAVGTDIRFGLAAIRNVGLPVVEAIIKAREEKGAFASFKDFLSKVPAVVCNKRTIESLIKGGAFDSLGESRRGMVEVHERYIDALVEVKKQEAIGQDSLFGAFGLSDEAAEPAEPGAFDGLPPVPPLRVGQGHPAVLRARDARPLRLRPPALRHRAHPRRRTPTPRSPRSRATTPRPMARRSPSPGSSRACSSSGPRRATSGPSPRSRTSTAPSSASSSRRPT